MNTLTFCSLVIFLLISQCHCSEISCKTNCTADETCWRQALAFHSTELIERLFSFSSLAIHVDTFQQEHSSELNDSIEFLDQALEKYLSNESSANNLTMDLFAITKTLLIDFCVNLTAKKVETIDDLPALMCPALTCAGDQLSYMTIFIITLVSATSILIVCIVQSFQTYKRIKAKKLMKEIKTLTNSTALNDSSSASQF